MFDSCEMITVQNLKKIYRTGFFRKKDISVLQNISFSIAKGTSFGLVGSSGSGKSTIANILLGLEAYDSGSVLYKHKSIKEWCKFENLAFRKSCQLLSQNPYASVYPKYTVEEVLAEVYLIHHKRFDDIARRFCINQLEEVKLAKSILSRKISELSGGELQRVCLARCLLIEPETIILDEPTTQLDTIAQDIVLNILKELKLKHNLTYLFISHDIDLMSFMTDSLAVISEGVIIENGSTDKVLSEPKTIFTSNLIDSHYNI